MLAGARGRPEKHQNGLTQPRIYNLHYKGAQTDESFGSGPTHPHNKGPG